MNLRTLSLTITLLLLIIVPDTLAQPRPSEDSAKVYRLGEIVVVDDSIARVTPVTVQKLELATINRTDAPTVAGVAYQIPAARIQTNSRGEALLYMRNAGERQVALFFDGALLNVPWDNRVDLSLVPLNAVGGLTISKGVPSVLYGANVIGGAVNIATQEVRTPGSMTDMVLQGGNGSYFNGSLVHLGMSGPVNYVASAAWSQRDGIPLPKDAALPFNQPDPNLRTNTDSRIASAFLQGEYHVSDVTRYGLSVNVIDAEKGVAPEGHVEDARFWRYPLWRNITVIANGSTSFEAGTDMTLTGALWGTSFRQDIEAYPDAEYLIPSSRQEDQDFTLGARGVLRAGFDNGAISLALNALQSTHEQTDIDLDSTGAPILTESPDLFTYRQQTFSLGLEFERRFGDLLIVTGTSLDGMTTPETGDKPSQDAFLDYSVMGGLSYDLTEEFATRLSFGRKTRFPTMRELYGESLNRFLINPDLKPEESVLAELGVDGRYDAGRFEVVGFMNATTNTIDQRNLDTLGGRRRQRINLPGSRLFGIEASGSLFEFRPLRLDGHFTYTHARGRGSSSTGADSTFLLSEKPEIIATLTAGYDFTFGLLTSLEVVHTGTSYTLNDDNVFVENPTSTALNARLGYRIVLPLGEATLAQVFIRVNNINDEVVLPQLGLPSAGREIVGGMKVSF